MRWQHCVATGHYNLAIHHIDLDGMVVRPRMIANYMNGGKPMIVYTLGWLGLLKRLTRCWLTPAHVGYQTNWFGGAITCGLIV